MIFLVGFAAERTFISCLLLHSTMDLRQVSTCGLANPLVLQKSRPCYKKIS